MTQKEKNIQLFEEIKRLSEQIIIDGETTHDFIFVCHVENTPKGKANAELNLYQRGCPCNFGATLIKLAEMSPKFCQEILSVTSNVALIALQQGQVYAEKIVNVTKRQQPDKN